MRYVSGFQTFQGLADGVDMLLVGATAATSDVDEAVLCHLAYMTRRIAGQLVVLAHLVGQAGIGMQRQIYRDALGQQLDKGSKVCHAKRTVQSKAQQVGVVAHTDEEGLQRLTCQGASAAVVDGGRHHHRYLAARLLVQLLNGIECCLGVQGVEAGLHQQHVGPTVHESLGLFVIHGRHLVERCGSVAWLVHVGCQRERPRRGTHRACHKDWPLCATVGHLTGYPGTFLRHLIGHLLASVLMLTDTVRREGVGGNDVGTCLHIQSVNLLNHLWCRQTQDVVVACQRYGPLCKLASLIMLWGQSKRLNLRAHGTIQNQYLFF